MSTAEGARGRAEREAWRSAHEACTDELEDVMRRTFTALDDLTTLTPEDFARRERPEAWTVAQILEHTALASSFLLILVAKLRSRSERALDRGELWPTGPPRIRDVLELAAGNEAWPHPEHMTPVGAFDALRLRATFSNQATEALAHLRALPPGAGTLHRIRMSRVPGDDRLGLADYVAVLTGHAARHVRQIERTLRGPSRAPELREQRP